MPATQPFVGMQSSYPLDIADLALALPSAALPHLIQRCQRQLSPERRRPYRSARPATREELQEEQVRLERRRAARELRVRCILYEQLTEPYPPPSTAAADPLGDLGVGTGGTVAMSPSPPQPLPPPPLRPHPTSDGAGGPAATATTTTNTANNVIVGGGSLQGNSTGYPSPPPPAPSPWSSPYPVASAGTPSLNAAAAADLALGCVIHHVHRPGAGVAASSLADLAGKELLITSRRKRLALLHTHTAHFLASQSQSQSQSRTAEGSPLHASPLLLRKYEKRHTGFTAAEMAELIISGAVSGHSSVLHGTSANENSNQDEPEGEGGGSPLRSVDFPCEDDLVACSAAASSGGDDHTEEAEAAQWPRRLHVVPDTPNFFRLVSCGLMDQPPLQPPQQQQQQQRMPLATFSSHGSFAEEPGARGAGAGGPPPAPRMQFPQHWCVAASAWAQPTTTATTEATTELGGGAFSALPPPIADRAGSVSSSSGGVATPPVVPTDGSHDPAPPLPPVVRLISRSVSDVLPAWSWAAAHVGATAPPLTAEGPQTGGPLQNEGSGAPSSPLGSAPAQPLAVVADSRRGVSPAVPAPATERSIALYPAGLAEAVAIDRLRAALRRQKPSRGKRQRLHPLLLRYLQQQEQREEQQQALYAKTAGIETTSGRDMPALGRCSTTLDSKPPQRRHLTEEVLLRRVLLVPAADPSSDGVIASAAVGSPTAAARSPHPTTHLVVIKGCPPPFLAAANGNGGGEGRRLQHANASVLSRQLEAQRQAVVGACGLPRCASGDAIGSGVTAGGRPAAPPPLETGCLVEVRAVLHCRSGALDRPLDAEVETSQRGRTGSDRVQEVLAGLSAWRHHGTLSTRLLQGMLNDAALRLLCETPLLPYHPNNNNINATTTTSSSSSSPAQRYCHAGDAGGGGSEAVSNSSAGAAGTITAAAVMGKDMGDQRCFTFLSVPPTKPSTAWTTKKLFEYAKGSPKLLFGGAEGLRNSGSESDDESEESSSSSSSSSSYDDDESEESDGDHLPAGEEEGGKEPGRSPLRGLAIVPPQVDQNVRLDVFGLHAQVNPCGEARHNPVLNAGGGTARRKKHMAKKKASSAAAAEAQDPGVDVIITALVRVAGCVPSKTSGSTSSSAGAGQDVLSHATLANRRGMSGERVERSSLSVSSSFNQPPSALETPPPPPPAPLATVVEVSESWLAQQVMRELFPESFIFAEPLKELAVRQVYWDSDTAMEPLPEDGRLLASAAGQEGPDRSATANGRSPSRDARSADREPHSAASRAAEEHLRDSWWPVPFRVSPVPPEWIHPPPRFAPKATATTGPVVAGQGQGQGQGQGLVRYHSRSGTNDLPFSTSEEDLLALQQQGGGNSRQRQRGSAGPGPYPGGTSTTNSSFAMTRSLQDPAGLPPLPTRTSSGIFTNRQLGQGPSTSYYGTSPRQSFSAQGSIHSRGASSLNTSVGKDPSNNNTNTNNNNNNSFRLQAPPPTACRPAPHTAPPTQPVVNGPGNAGTPPSYEDAQQQQQLRRQQQQETSGGEHSGKRRPSNADANVEDPEEQPLVESRIWHVPTETASLTVHTVALRNALLRRCGRVADHRRTFYDDALRKAEAEVTRQPPAGLSAAAGKPMTPPTGGGESGPPITLLRVPSKYAKAISKLATAYYTEKVRLLYNYAIRALLQQSPLCVLPALDVQAAMTEELVKLQEEAAATVQQQQEAAAAGTSRRQRRSKPQRQRQRLLEDQQGKIKEQQQLLLLLEKHRSEHATASEEGDGAGAEGPISLEAPRDCGRWVQRHLLPTLQAVEALLQQAVREDPCTLRLGLAPPPPPPPAADLVAATGVSLPMPTTPLQEHGAAAGPKFACGTPSAAAVAGGKPQPPSTSASPAGPPQIRPLDGDDVRLPALCTAHLAFPPHVHSTAEAMKLQEVPPPDAGELQPAVFWMAKVPRQTYLLRSRELELDSPGANVEDSSGCVNGSSFTSTTSSTLAAAAAVLHGGDHAGSPSMPVLLRAVDRGVWLSERYLGFLQRLAAEDSEWMERLRAEFFESVWEKEVRRPLVALLHAMQEESWGLYLEGQRLKLLVCAQASSPQPAQWKEHQHQQEGVEEMVMETTTMGGGPSPSAVARIGLGKRSSRLPGGLGVEMELDTTAETNTLGGMTEETFEEESCEVAASTAAATGTLPSSAVVSDEEKDKEEEEEEEEVEAVDTAWTSTCPTPMAGKGKDRHHNPPGGAKEAPPHKKKTCGKASYKSEPSTASAPPLPSAGGSFVWQGSGAAGSAPPHDGKSRKKKATGKQTHASKSRATPSASQQSGSAAVAASSSMKSVGRGGKRGHRGAHGSGESAFSARLWNYARIAQILFVVSVSMVLLAVLLMRNF